MDKITEEVITALIGRIEKLEEKISRLSIPDKKGFHPATKPGMATEGQLNFIKGLGGNPWPEMTKQEASDEINKLKAIKENYSQRTKPDRVKSDKGRRNGGQPQGDFDQDGQTSDTFESKQLTKEEIDELGEEAFL